MLGAAYCTGSAFGLPTQVTIELELIEHIPHAAAVGIAFYISMHLRGRKNLRIGFYFAGLIFVVCQSTAKTTKIGPLKNSRYTVLTLDMHALGGLWYVCVCVCMCVSVCTAIDKMRYVL